MSQAAVLNTFETILTMDYGTRFFKADLHFHTPASADARGSNRYNFNPYARQRQEQFDSREKIMAESVKIAAKIVERHLEEKVSVVAITDHNCIGTLWMDPEASGNFMDLTAPTWYELIDDEARKINEAAGRQVLTILPGVEISNSGIHLLAIFPPQNPRRTAHFIICDLLKEAGFRIDEWGVVAATGRTSVYDTIEFVTRRGGIVIPAHIDGSDQALLRLFRLTSSNMKNILMNENLAAVEIVNPARIQRVDPKLKKSVKKWMDDFRRDADLNTFAFTQGSDAHDLPTIGKRYSLVKMTTPSFEGLNDAIKIPSSRVRLSDEHKPWDGLFILGVEVNTRFLGKKTIRFNRYLNCISGNRDTGKSIFFKLMQCAVNEHLPLEEGSVSVFMEAVRDEERRFYAYYRDSRKQGIQLYEIDRKNKEAKRIEDPDQNDHFVKPRFFIPGRIDEISESHQAFQDFFTKHFGQASETAASKFNDLFSVPLFLEESKAQILRLAVQDGNYVLSFNVNWTIKGGRERFVDFFSLSKSKRRCALIIILIICTHFGPVNIDAPEDFLDNSDISGYLAPIIRKYKDHKQINIISANPSIAVNADPDNYILFGMNSRNRVEVHAGFSIDELQNKSRLIDLLEGSMNSFIHRKQRYENTV